MAAPVLNPPKSILWVDDEGELLEPHRIFLRSKGYTVEWASNADDAIELLRRRPFDILLLDEQMPGKRGLEVFRDVRELAPTLPVVMVTKSEEDSTLKEAIGANIRDYLVKPINPRQVLTVVTRILEGPRIRQQAIARSFVERFRAIELERERNLDWRGWIDRYDELMRWDVDLAAAGEMGLYESLQGLYPAMQREFAARLPDWWGNADREDESLNAHERELLETHLEELSGRTPVRYQKISTAANSDELERHLGTAIGPEGVSAFVFNFVDLLTHGRSESQILYEVARDEIALRQITRQWFQRSALFSVLKEASRRRISVLLTTDHGSIHCNTPATVYAKRDASANLSYKFGEDLRAERPDQALLFSNEDMLRLPRRGAGGNTLLATNDCFFVYPTKLREYQSRYRGSFLHGGVTPEEVILPLALLTPRR